MFNIPDKYRRNDNIDIKQFMPPNAKKAEKDRIKSAVQRVDLICQIAGEEIPSLVNDTYNCLVIMMFDIKLKSIKDAAFISGIVQELVKAPCVIRFYDTGNEVYSFAHKRLNLSDSKQIVVLDKVLTAPASRTFDSKQKELMQAYLDWDSLKNKTNKLALYLEMMVKAYIIDNLDLYSKMADLLDANIWYNTDEVLVLYDKLKQLEALAAELGNTVLPGDKVRINGEIKKLIGNISE